MTSVQLLCMPLIEIPNRDTHTHTTLWEIQYPQDGAEHAKQMIHSANIQRKRHTSGYMWPDNSGRGDQRVLELQKRGNHIQYFQQEIPEEASGRPGCSKNAKWHTRPSMTVGLPKRTRLISQSSVWLHVMCDELSKHASHRTTQMMAGSPNFGKDLVAVKIKMPKWHTR